MADAPAPSVPSIRGCGVGLCRQASQVVCGVGLRCGLAQALHPGLTGGVAVSHAWRDRYVRLLTLSSRIASELLITFAPKQDLS